MMTVYGTGPSTHHYARGWNACLRHCIDIICPASHVEEERSCEEIKHQLEAFHMRVLLMTTHGELPPENPD